MDTLKPIKIERGLWRVGKLVVCHCAPKTGTGHKQAWTWKDCASGKIIGYTLKDVQAVAKNLAQRLTIETTFGYYEPAKNPCEAAKKIIAACVHSAPPQPIRSSSGVAESTRLGGCFSITYYERDIFGKKHFVARVSGNEDDVHQVVRLTPDYSGALPGE